MREEGSTMEIKRSGSRPSRKGPAENFTGSVRIDPLFEPPDPTRVFGALVTFEPGARTAWHTHPLGQTLIVTSGCGWTQCWDGRKEEIRPGDVIWCPPGKKHWHGATATTAMSHIAIVEKLIRSLAIRTLYGGSVKTMAAFCLPSSFMYESPSSALPQKILC
jgi:quercetin dioxygenase-like cupin family protein